jgi:predicted lipid-binding transport protein (Tim44 family)
MRRAAAGLIVLAMLCSTVAMAPEAWARAGGGGFKGSRGSRSYTAPARPSAPPSAPASPTSPASVRPPAPQRSGWSGLMGGLGGFMLGGLLGGLLFGGLFRGGLAGGLGLLDLLILGALAYLAYSWLRRRQAGAAGAASLASGVGVPPAWAEREAPSAPRPEPPPAAEPGGAGDLARGLGHIRQVDAAFDPRAFADRAAEIFRDVQGAWTRQDLSAISGVLTPEMLGEMQKDADAFRAEGKVNHLDQIAVRDAEVTEAWQEKGQDFVTVRFQASLLDYTTDRQGAIVEGSANEPVTFEEYWTFTRPVWARSWRLSAIQQPAGR